MNIGIAKEKAGLGKEVRVALLPSEVKKIVHEGHKVFVEKDAGSGVHATNEDYQKAGATIVKSPRTIFRKEMVIKIKPPLPQEFNMMHNNILFSMLHAEQNPQYLRKIRERKIKAIVMEEIKNSFGERLVECTEMTGHQGMLMAFHLSAKIPQECKVLVLGYGSVAKGAINAIGSLGAKLKILRKNEYKHIKHFLRNKDVIVNAIKWPKSLRNKKEYLITRDMLKLLHPEAIVLDLSVDYPNPIETCHPTQINKPCYFVDGILHISIYGYPGLAPISSSRRYSRQICHLVLEITEKGLDNAPRHIKKAIIS